MLAMARVMGRGRGGEKADRLRLSQPSGGVRTASSNSRDEPSCVVMMMLGSSPGLDLDFTDVTLVERRTSAFAKMILATRSRIAL